MPTIDADCHVLETDRTWAYMGASERQYQPQTVASVTPEGRKEFWLIDGRLHPRSDNVGKDTPEEAREMANIDARLRHMDELDVDTQVLYPTVFLRPISRRPEVDLAVCRSYNRWLADIWAHSRGRLRWAVVPPLLNMEQALEELRFGHAHGACAVFMRGLEDQGRICDAYFHPLYREAARLNLAIGVHSGIGHFEIHDFFAQEAGFCKFKLIVIGAFHSLALSDVPTLFPDLRIGIIEVSAQWIPHALHDLASRFRRRGRTMPEDLLREYRFYVACQTDDDLDVVLSYAGQDNLIIGSDYGHADTSSELEALRNLKRQGKVPARVIDNILDDNPRAFYGL